MSEAANAEFAAIFAPYILQYPGTEIAYNSHPVDPSLTIDRTKEFGTRKVVCPSGTIRNITIKVIEWKAKGGSDGQSRCAPRHAGRYRPG